jgi:hypothetical protein
MLYGETFTDPNTLMKSFDLWDEGISCMLKNALIVYFGI